MNAAQIRYLIDGLDLPPPAVVQPAGCRPVAGYTHQGGWESTKQAELPSVEEIVDAIGKAENSVKYPYGIKPFYEKTKNGRKLVDPKGDVAMSRRICVNTVRNNLARWKAAGQPGDFIQFLGDRFCPTKGATDDPTGLNKNWVGNVKKFLRK